MRKLVAIFLLSLTTLGLTAGPALACGGLVAPNGTINLLRTSTLAAYTDGVEHYVTSFEFAGGGGGEFGSIIPLPGVPTKVQRGGRWTLQRLVQEVQPPAPEFLSFDAAAGGARLKAAEVLQEVRIDALDITILKGGGDEVGKWAKDNGFNLPPDAPEILDFYASRSPIFMAARFDAGAAKDLGQRSGDGTPVHLTIPTPNPWVPLRILTLGRQPQEKVEADVFLLTDNVPAMLPAPSPSSGMLLDRSVAANELLLTDLRQDKGMGWLPTKGMWLTYLKIDGRASTLTHDLAIDTSPFRSPSPVAAGLTEPSQVFVPEANNATWLAWVVAAGMCALVLAGSGKLLGSRE